MALVHYVCAWLEDRYHLFYHVLKSIQNIILIIYLTSMFVVKNSASSFEFQADLCMFYESLGANQ